jgi:hypothetical protein
MVSAVVASWRRWAGIAAGPARRAMSIRRATDLVHADGEDEGGGGLV